MDALDPLHSMFGTEDAGSRILSVKRILMLFSSPHYSLDKDGETELIIWTPLSFWRIRRSKAKEDVWAEEFGNDIYSTTSK